MKIKWIAIDLEKTKSLIKSIISDSECAKKIRERKEKLKDIIDGK